MLDYSEQLLSGLDEVELEGPTERKQARKDGNRNSKCSVCGQVVHSDNTKRHQRTDKIFYLYLNKNLN